MVWSVLKGPLKTRYRDFRTPNCFTGRFKEWCRKRAIVRICLEVLKLVVACSLFYAASTPKPYTPDPKTHPKTHKKLTNDSQAAHSPKTSSLATRLYINPLPMIPTTLNPNPNPSVRFKSASLSPEGPTYFSAGAVYGFQLPSLFGAMDGVQRF